MKLLLDECVVQDFRHSLRDHDVFTVAFMGWAGIKNGRLLALAAGEKFDALLTTDRAMEHEQDSTSLPLSVVILHAVTNDLTDILPLVPQLLASLATLSPKQIAHVRL